MTAIGSPSERFRSPRPAANNTGSLFGFLTELLTARRCGDQLPALT